MHSHVQIRRRSWQHITLDGILADLQNGVSVDGKCSENQVEGNGLTAGITKFVSEQTLSALGSRELEQNPSGEREVFDILGLAPAGVLLCQLRSER